MFHQNSSVKSKEFAMSICIFINWPPYKNYSTCSQESHLSLWLPFLFVRVVNICKTHAVLYCQFYETLNHRKFSKNLGNKGKLQVSSYRCLLRQNDPRDEYLGDIFYQTAPILQWCTLDQTLWMCHVWFATTSEKWFTTHCSLIYILTFAQYFHSWLKNGVTLNPMTIIFFVFLLRIFSKALGNYN